LAGIAAMPLYSRRHVRRRRLMIIYGAPLMIIYARFMIIYGQNPGKNSPPTYIVLMIIYVRLGAD
jgi:hypothetical protein